MKTTLFTALLLLTCHLCAASVESVGPFGGSAAIVQVDPRVPGTVLAATSNALLFRSTNGGDSWSRVAFPVELRATLHALVIAPQNGVYFVAVANDDREHAGIYRSADQGQTWTRLATLGEREVWSIGLWSRDSAVMAAGTSDGVFLSRDSGDHWDRISPESNRALMPIVSLAFDPNDDRTLYVGTPHLPWRTVDGGLSWQFVHAGMNDDSDVFSIHVDERQPSRLFASACSGMYRSLNRGVSWTKLVGARDASYRTYQIIQHPTQPNVVFAGTAHGLVRSTDGGTSWRRLSTYPTRSIAFDSHRSGRVFVATDDAGLFRSDDLGESFKSINEGFCNRHVFSLAASGNVFYVSSSSGGPNGAIVRSAYPAKAWEGLASLPPLFDQQALKIEPIDSNRLYALTSKHLLTSRDGGGSWSVLFSPVKEKKLTSLLVATPEGRKLLVGAEDGIYYTEDGGSKWQPARVPQEQSEIRGLEMLGENTVAAITRSALLLSDDGINFKSVTYPGDSELFGLVATDRQTLLAATARGLMRSENNGATWERIAGALWGNTVYTVCKHPDRPGLLFAARRETIFTSRDDGRSWNPLTAESEGMVRIRSMVVLTGIPTTLFAVTARQGIFAISLDSLLAEVGEHDRKRERASVKQDK